MDRHNRQHLSARVELPASLQTTQGWDRAASAARGRRLPAIAGLAGVLGVGVVVIATAAMLAMHVS